MGNNSPTDATMPARIGGRTTDARVPVAVSRLIAVVGVAAGDSIAWRRTDGAVWA